MHYTHSFAYRAFGALKGMSYGNGLAFTASYDTRMRPTTWNVAGVLGYNYNYDYFNERTGRVSYAESLTDPSLDRSYEYDHAGRLAIAHSGAEARAATGQGPWGNPDGPFSQGYDYDVWGNLTRRYGWGGEVQGGGPQVSTPDLNYTYTNNRRTDSSFAYDNAGNLVFDGGQNFAYDVTGQQTSASYGGYSLQQGYDGDGLRVRKDDNGEVVYYLRSSVLGGQVVCEVRYTPAWGWHWSRGYVYLGSQMLAVQWNGAVSFVHEDPVTKSKRVTDMNGGVVSTIETDPWGADTIRSGNVAFQPRKYTSYERDGNGSDEAMYRRYNRWHARFDQPDPYDGSYDLTDPQSFNRYAYTQNDPVNFVDPSGLNLEAGGGGGSCWYRWTATGWYDANNNLVNVTDFSASVTCYGGGGGGNTGGRGPGDPGGGGPGPIDGGDDKKNLPFNNCSQFVDYLVNLTTEATKKNLVQTLTVSNAREVASTLGAGMATVSYYGYSQYIHNGADGFKNNLTQGGQGAGVYGHILGQAGVSLTGFGGKLAGAAIGAYDLFQEVWENTKERAAEVDGNRAGVAVGNHMWNFISGNTPRDPDRLRNSLTQQLCQ